MTEERFDPEGQVPRQEVTIEDSTATNETDAEPAQGAGTGANTATQPAQANNQGPSKTSNTSRSSKTQSYEINKTLTNTVKNPGAITRISAAVFLAEKSSETGELTPRTPEQINELRSMVINALGIEVPKNENPSSFVSIKEVAFPSTVTAGAPLTDKVGGYVEMIRPIAALAIAGIVFAIFFFMLRRAKPEEISFELVDENTNTPQPAGALPDIGGAEDPASFLPAAKNLKVSPELLNSLIRQKPENVGATLREWLIDKNNS